VVSKSLGPALFKGFIGPVGVEAYLATKKSATGL